MDKGKNSAIVCVFVLLVTNLLGIADQVFLQPLNLSSKTKKWSTDTTLLGKVEANKEEIEILKTVLATLQEEKCHRNKMTEKRHCAMSSGGATMMIGNTPMTRAAVRMTVVEMIALQRIMEGIEGQAILLKMLLVEMPIALQQQALQTS